MSFVSVNHTRTALKNFVKEPMAEDDLVAIISTSGGISSLQQFTTDKRVLNSAIDRVRFMLGGPVDARGLPDFGIQAQDDVSGLESFEVTDAIKFRVGKFLDEQEAMHFLAAQTGGLSQFFNNDINQALVRMTQDQAGYICSGFKYRRTFGSRASAHQRRRPVI